MALGAFGAGLSDFARTYRVARAQQLDEERQQKELERQQKLLEMAIARDEFEREQARLAQAEREAARAREDARFLFQQAQETGSPLGADAAETIRRAGYGGLLQQRPALTGALNVPTALPFGSAVMTPQVEQRFFAPQTVQQIVAQRALEQQQELQRRLAEARSPDERYAALLAAGRVDSPYTPSEREALAEREAQQEFARQKQLAQMRLQNAVAARTTGRTPADMLWQQVYGATVSALRPTIEDADDPEAAMAQIAAAATKAANEAVAARFPQAAGAGAGAGEKVPVTLQTLNAALEAAKKQGQNYHESVAAIANRVFDDPDATDEEAYLAYKWAQSKGVRIDIPK